MAKIHGLLFTAVLAFVMMICPETKAQSSRNMTYTVNGVSFQMIAVKGGTFTMGCDSPDREICEDDDKPAHTVTLSDYYIGEFEVTRELWGAVTGHVNDFTADKDLPISEVNWKDVQDFIQQLNQQTGLQFRMPTEAEWEFAAKGGTKSKGYTYSGGNDLDLVAWHPGNCKETQTVGKKRPNELGIYDMSGNVREWCQDCHVKYSGSSQTNPCVNNSRLLTNRVLRGGGYTSYGGYIVTSRDHGFDGLPLRDYGCRLAISGDEAMKPIKTQTKVHNEKVIPGNAQLENRFSVAPNTVVYFSKGNLQYQASTGKWRFAEQPWDYIGESNNKISSSYSGWIDLFGCGTGDDPTQPSITATEFHDWGDNTISNGKGKKWRTLTSNEWIYVLSQRETSSGIRYAHAKVDGVNGLILLPDNWKNEYYQLDVYNSSTAVFTNNRVSKQDWKDKLEAHGAIFLPAAGMRKGVSVSKDGVVGYYWSSWLSRGQGAFIIIADGRVRYNDYTTSSLGFSVRLVSDL